MGNMKMINKNFFKFIISLNNEIEIRRLIPPVEEKKCPNNHILIEFHTMKVGFKCDICHKEKAKKIHFFGCF